MIEVKKVIVFQLKGQQYGVEIERILSIEKLEEVTEVPKTSDFIKGLMNLRGQITPIIDLSERLQLGKTKYTNETRVLIANIHHMQVGLIVDAATDVIDVNSSVIEPAPKMMSHVEQTFIQGVAKLETSLLVLLDLGLVLNMEEIDELELVIEE